MFLPADYLWFEPVLFATIIVFIISWIGNSILFSNRFLNALVTSIVFAAVFGAVAYFGFGSITMKASLPPSATAPAATPPTQPAQPPANQ